MIESGFGLMRYQLFPFCRLIEGRNDIVQQRKISKRSCPYLTCLIIRFVEALSNKLMEVDPTIPPLPIKDVVCNL